MEREKICYSCGNLINTSRKKLNLDKVRCGHAKWPIIWYLWKTAVCRKGQGSFAQCDSDFMLKQWSWPFLDSIFNTFFTSWWDTFWAIYVVVIGLKIFRNVSNFPGFIFAPLPHLLQVRNVSWKSGSMWVLKRFLENCGWWNLF